MGRKTPILLLACFATLLFCTFSQAQQVFTQFGGAIRNDTIDLRKMHVDSVETLGNLSFKSFKKKAHASYYADRFNGKRTASGVRFNNKYYTAAHRSLPFGTKLRITNEENGKCVIVEVNDRGPFSKGREIDISRRAFMEITHNRGSGGIDVKIEIVR